MSDVQARRHRRRGPRCPTAPRRARARRARPGAGRGRSRAARRAPAWPRRAPPRWPAGSRAARRGERRAGHAEVEREGGEALLRAVVEVALDAAALGVGGVDDARARLLEVGDPRRQLLAAGLAEHRPHDREVEREEPAGQPRREQQREEADRRRRAQMRPTPSRTPPWQRDHLGADPRPQRGGHEHEAAAPAERHEPGRGREQGGSDERVVGQLSPRRRPAQPGSQPRQPRSAPGAARRRRRRAARRRGPGASGSARRTGGRAAR